MITLQKQEANHLNLIENPSTNSPTLDDLFDFYPDYSSESCMHCFESSSCLQNYHILPVHHHCPPSEDLGDFKPLFSTLENSFLDQEDCEEWLEPFPLDDEESDSIISEDCACGGEVGLDNEQSGCNCRVFNWLLEEYEQKRWGNSSESPLCLVDAPLGSHHDLVALIEEYFELNAIPSDNFNDLMNFVMFNQNLPKSASKFIINTKINNNTNDIIANMSKALAKSLLCTSNENNMLGESPVRVAESQLVIRKRDRTPFVKIPLQLFSSLGFSTLDILARKSRLNFLVFYTLQGRYQQKQASKAQKVLAIKQQEEIIAVPEAPIEMIPEEILTIPQQQTEQVRYRLVKKSDIKRDALNSSCLSSVSSYNNEGYREKSKNSPKPTFLLENFLSSITEDEKEPPVEQNSSDEDHLLDLGLGLKKNDNKTDEENTEVETRAGSQKEQEQESLLHQFDGFSEFTFKTSSIIEKTNIEDFEEGFSQASSENLKAFNSRHFQENDGFIQILDKRKGKKERKDKGKRDRGYGKLKHESNKKEESKGKARETAYQTVVYEAKNKPEGPKAKILTPILPKASPAKTIIPMDNYAPAPVIAEKPKRKALSVKSACLDVNIIKTTKVKEFVKKYCEKKFEEDLNEYVGQITEESNKMMDYRMLVHTRIDYCLKKVFEGIDVQTKIFGSCATGLALPTSDVDICLCGLPTYSRNEVIQYITTIYDKLKKFKWVFNIKQILTSTVPIVKLEIDPTIDFKELNEELDEYSILRGMIEKAPEDLDCLKNREGNRRIKIDLSIENFSPLGTSAPHLGYRTTEFVQKKLNEYESLYAVAMYLKEYLTKKGFLDNYQGGISSYCLVIMIVAIFRKFTDEGGMKSLKRLLQFYGEEFEPEKTGINVVGAEPFFPLNYSFDEVPLWIMDNANFAGRSLGQGAFGIKRIFQEFAGSVRIVRKTQEKMEAVVLKYKERVDKIEDIEKIDDAELKELIEMNIAEKLIMSE